jgi:hypothetical protein
MDWSSIGVSDRGIGRSDLEKSAPDSPVEDTSSAPVSSRIRFAFFVHSDIVAVN